MKTGDMMTEIFLDIETYGGPDKPTKDDIKIPANYKKQETIEAYIKAQLPHVYKDQALDHYKAEIVCVGVAVEDQDPFVFAEKTEEETLDKLDIFLQGYTYKKIIGFNINDFDAHILFLRGLKYAIAGLVHNFCDTSNLIDIMVLTYGSAYRGRVKPPSLDKLCKYFGFEGKTDMDGSMVHAAYLNGEIEKICRYCEDDVFKTRLCYKKLYELGVQ